MVDLFARLGRGIWIGLVLLALSSCGDDTATPKSGSAPPTVTVLQSIAVTPANPSVTTGTTQQFLATGTYSDGSQVALTSKATWASATPTVATINAAGLANAIATGSADVTAMFDGVTSTATTLTATAAPRVVKSIEVTPSFPTVPAGVAQAFKAIGTFTDNATADISAAVTWAAATPAVATASGSGVATAVSVGTSNITATCVVDTICQGLSGSATLNVTAAALVSIGVTPANPGVAKGMTQQFTAAGTYTDGTQAALTSQASWVSATPAVGTINAAGLASGASIGTSEITATFGGVSSPATTLTVTAAALTSLQIFGPGISIVQGTSQQYSASGTYSDGTSSDVTANVIWNSIDTSVAAFQSGGVVGDVTAGQPGTSTISASLGVIASNQLALTVTPPATILTTSVATLALSVTGLYPGITGTARQLTITNTGAAPAINITVVPSPALPVGTTLASTCAAGIAAGGNCVVTITPGATPSAAPGDTSPVPITLTVQGDNTNALNPAVTVLTYGSVYQSGFVFSVDDSTPASGSIGGKVAALVDQASSIQWSQSFAVVYGIDDTSTNSVASPALPSSNTAGYEACDGATDGACNQRNLNRYYPGGSQSSYAVEICDPLLGGFSDWYLPAICELGYNVGNNGSPCGTSSNPTRQNIQSNLVDSAVPGTGIASDYYYSSTEGAAAAQVYAWVQHTLAGGAAQYYTSKLQSSPVRCVRALTP